MSSNDKKLFNNFNIILSNLEAKFKPLQEIPRAPMAESVGAGQLKFIELVDVNISQTVAANSGGCAFALNGIPYPTKINYKFVPVTEELHRTSFEINELYEILSGNLREEFYLKLCESFKVLFPKKVAASDMEGFTLRMPGLPGEYIRFTHEPMLGSSSIVELRAYYSYYQGGVS